MTNGLGPRALMNSCEHWVALKQVRGAWGAGLQIHPGTRQMKAGRGALQHEECKLEIMENCLGG